MPITGTSARFTSDPGKVAVTGGAAGSMASAPTGRIGLGPARAGGRRRAGPRVSDLPGRAKRIDPHQSRSRRTSRRVGTYEGEPLVLEGPVFSPHPGHQLVDPVDPGSDNRGMAQPANISPSSAGGPRVGGLTDAKGSKAIPSRLARPHRGVRERPGARVACPDGGIGPIGVASSTNRSGADSVGSPPGRGLGRRGGRSRSGGGVPLTLDDRVMSRVGGPADDTHRNPVTRAGGSPEGPSEVVTLIGTGDDEVGSAMPDGPTRTKAGVVIVPLLTREARGSRILTGDRARGQGLTLHPVSGGG